MTKPPLELATEENFDEELYLLANPDVARHVANGGDARDHIVRHGQREGRHQWTPAAVGRTGTRAQRKYLHFADLLDASRGAGGSFRFLREQDAFPIAYGGPTHSLDEYDDESANPGLGDFVEVVRANPDRRYLDVGSGRRSRRFD